jgi:hypothetical protein
LRRTGPRGQHRIGLGAVPGADRAFSAQVPTAGVRAVITQGVRGYGSATSRAVGVPTRPAVHGHH